MTERSDLLDNIANIIIGYRKGDLPAPTPDHVDRWASQFTNDVQLPLLREMHHCFKFAYLTRSDFKNWYTRLLESTKITGGDHASFWSSACLMKIQINGGSQAEIFDIFAQAMKEKLNLIPVTNASDSTTFVYLDDVLFSGGRIGADLIAWMEGEAPQKARVLIVLMASHAFGEYKTLERLKKKAKELGKEITFEIWRGKIFENRRYYRANSEVLWPAILPEDVGLTAYLAANARFPFEPRPLDGKLKQPIFSSEQGRQLLEREMLLAGLKIRSFSQKPSDIVRPLGYSPFGLGFGSMITTYRNCPNNSPLALWWGDLTAATSHPFSKWYPLLQRKTYAKEFDFDDVEF